VTAISDTLVRMDRMYRYQRYIYDVTRKFYLLGRDRLLDELVLSPGDHVLEIGCGTGRNLRALARRHPGVQFYGIDASAPMLATAARSIGQAGLAGRIRLAHGLAERLDPASMFGLRRPLDAIVISYALTMIPSWAAVVETAVHHLRPGGRLAVVDFSDQSGLPAWFRRLLVAWLAAFDVRLRAGLPDFFRNLVRTHGGTLRIEQMYGGYAFRLVYTAPAH